MINSRCMQLLIGVNQCQFNLCRFCEMALIFSKSPADALIYDYISLIFFFFALITSFLMISYFSRMLTFRLRNEICRSFRQTSVLLFSLTSLSGYPKGTCVKSLGFFFGTWSSSLVDTKSTTTLSLSDI